jgi:hypothetical protein
MIAALLARLFRRAGDLGAARDRDAIGRFYDAHVDGLYAFVLHRSPTGLLRVPCATRRAVQDRIEEASGLRVNILDARPRQVME